MEPKNREKAKATAAQRQGLEGLQRAERLFQADQARQAVEFLRGKIEANPEHRAFLERWGRLFMERRAYDSAVLVFQLVAGLFPQDARAHNPLSVALSMAGFQDEALKAMTRCVELAPESWRNRLNLGKLYMLNEDWARAKDTFDALEGEIPPGLMSQVVEMKDFCQEKLDFPIVRF
ncbi:hypothetical protein AAU61_05455 [Desulfocarbo indianensis]|nr:hypothetical protein AAU61_05455 [Desulfocarbo indianensis]